MAYRTGVIGAGIGGMAAAIRLAAIGHRVTIFEKNKNPGGKISQIEKKGYRFDTGPSVFTMPSLVEELFDLAGYKSSDFFKYDLLEESCKYFYKDGTVIRAYSDPEKFGHEVSEKTGERKENIEKFLQYSKTIYDLTSGIFVFNSIHDLKQLIRPHHLKAVLNFYKIDAFRTMHKANEAQFESEKVIQLFDRYATYNGSNPYEVPATLNIIPHLEHNMGAYFPKGGIYKLIQALYELALKIGVNFQLNTEVRKVEYLNNYEYKIETDAGNFPAEIVVSDSDIHYFYQNLFPDARMTKKVSKHEKSSSALIFYWGIDKEFPELNLHNILFSDDYPNEFDHLFKKKQVFDDPTVYIFISAKMNPTDAPRGKENWYVMVNAPENVGQDWKALKEKARENIVQKIKKTLNVDIDKHIEFEEVHDPVSIEENTGSYHGSLYGNSSNSRFAAFNRHPNFSRRYKGLYFVGGSVHPGGGIPLCLSSAKIVANKIKS